MKIRLTKPMSKCRARRRIAADIRKVSVFFPELEDATLTIGLASNGGGKAYPSLMKISVDPRRRFYSYSVIAHEMMHLIQGHNDIPQGERACDLWSMARSPLFADRPPNYLEIPEFMVERWELWNGFVRRKAIQAIRLRGSGLRKYIRWFEDELRKADPDLAEARVQSSQAGRRTSSIQLPLMFGPALS